MRSVVRTQEQGKVKDLEHRGLATVPPVESVDAQVGAYTTKVDR